MPQSHNENMPPPHTKNETPGEPGGSQKKPYTAKEIQTWLISQISQRLQIEPEEIDIREPFTSSGLSSREAVVLSGELEEWLGCGLSPTLLYEYPDIETLSQYLASDMDSCSREGSIVDETQNSEVESIAIIGIGCRFPGANGPEAFWSLLRDGVDAITEVPVDRWDPDFFYNPNPEIPGKMNTRWGGFLEQIDRFDSHFFGISPREAARMDPQQRLLLEVTWEALEDAGQAAAGLVGTKTGVFVGISSNDYSRIQASDHRLIDAYAGTGNALSIAANRISYIFNFHGPSIAVDTACSSSLVAVHLACRSISNGESALALVGGVNLIISPEITINFSKAGFMAPDGRCKTFDARANGYVRGEGAGMVILKPLSRALADGDRIYAVILGSAVNQDGRTNGLMAPNPQAQEEVLREAYKSAGVSPCEVQYIEAHGTGTFLGDPIEAKALGNVLAIDRAPGYYCAVGSVKTNIGHLEAAAGIASLIKVALSLQYQMIPASLHYQKPNPNIPFDHLPLRVQEKLTPWPEKPGAPIAGVSSFGFGGTNAHMVLSEAPKIPGVSERVEDPGYKWAQLLPLSAHSVESLQSLVRLYQAFLEAKPSPGDDAALKDICYTASVRRDHHDHRLSLIGRSREEIIEQLRAFTQGEIRPNMTSGRKVPGLKRKLVFVFPGQGSQWFGMGRKLLQQEPVFREALEQCHRALQPYVDWSLLEELALELEEERSRLKDIDVIQPTLFAFQVALTALWRSWGIKPDAVVGHSMGEVAAAHAAGALTLEDAVRIITRRSQLLKQASGKGSMAVVELTIEEAQRTITSYKDRVSIAVSNSPTSTVLSGDPAALKEILDMLEPQEIFCKPVKVDVASHSPQMDPLRNDLLQALKGIQPRPASLPIYSTVTGMNSEGLRFDAEYWVRNLREPVLFSTTVQQLLDSGHDIFIEISPHPIILSAISQILHHYHQEGTILPSLRREEDERSVMLGSLGALYTIGIPPDWKNLYPRGGRCIRLPSYPWQRERCWLELKGTKNTPFSGRSYVPGKENIHPLLGHYLYSAVNRGMYFWEIDLGTDLFPYLEDHRVQGVIVVPGAVYVEMALAASEKAFGTGHHVFEKLDFKKALFLPEEGTQTVQLVISAKMPGTASCQFFSLQVSDTEQQPSWTLHAEGTIRLGQTDMEAAPDKHVLPEKIKSRCSEVIPGVEHYQAMQERGLQYGPSFQGVEQIWRQDGEAIGRLRLSKMVANEADGYNIHPALLDACLQVLAATLSTIDSGITKGDTFLPVRMERLRFYNRPGTDIPLWSQAILRPGVEGNVDTFEGDVYLLDENGQVKLEVLGLRLQSLNSDKQRTALENVNNWLYEIRWEPKPRQQQDQPPEARPPDQRSSWLIFTDSSGIGQELKSLLEDRGESCIMVSPGQTYKRIDKKSFRLRPGQPGDMRQLFEEAPQSNQPACRGIVYLWSLDAPPPGESRAPLLEKAQTLGCGNVLHLVQELAQNQWRPSPRLWLVTQGTQPVEVKEKPAPLAVTQSPLWGFGRTIALEYSSFWGGMVDLDPGATAHDAVALLLEEILNPDDEDQLAFRQEQRYVARLVRNRRFDGHELPFQWRSDGSYLITGGLGDLGFRTARWMVEQGARRLILLGRTKLPPRTNWNQVEKGSPLANKIAAIRELEAQGISVHAASVDVADEAQFSSFLEQYRLEGWPPIRGVVHAAGVVKPGLLPELDAAALDSVLRPKVIGGWLLHLLLQDEPLDFFILFSSATSVLSSPRLAHYAAANAFLDALAHYRAALGQPALSVNWALWTEVGIAARYLSKGQPLLQGVEGFTPQQGLEILERLLRQNPTQSAVMRVNWQKWARLYPTFSKSPLLSFLLNEEANILSKSARLRKKGGLTRTTLLAADPGKQLHLLETHLCEQVAGVLGLPVSKLDPRQPLNNLGIDSLMAVELKNQAEADLGVVISVVKFLQGFSVSQLAVEFLTQLTDTNSTPLVPLTSAVTPEENKQDKAIDKDAHLLLSKIDQLSDEEVDSLLNDLLTKKDNEQ